MPDAGAGVVAMAKPADPREKASHCEANLCKELPYKQPPCREVDAGRRGARKAG